MQVNMIGEEPGTQNPRQETNAGNRPRAGNVQPPKPKREEPVTASAAAVKPVLPTAASCPRRVQEKATCS
jgi:hypothetical protein